MRANTGLRPELSEKPFSLKAQQADPELQAALLPPRKVPAPRTRNSRSDSRKRFHRHVVSGPYWSDATRAYRVEFYQAHRQWASHTRQSSFYCSEEADAIRLFNAAKRVKSWEQWLDLRTLAADLAIGRSDGFLYRMMAGEREVFIQPPRRT